MMMYSLFLDHSNNWVILTSKYYIAQPFWYEPEQYINSQFASELSDKSF